MTAVDLHPVDLPAAMTVTTDPANTVTLSFAVQDGGGSVSVAMSAGQAIQLAERLTEAAGRRAVMALNAGSHHSPPVAE